MEPHADRPPEPPQPGPLTDEPLVEVEPASAVPPGASPEEDPEWLERTRRFLVAAGWVLAAAVVAGVLLRGPFGEFMLASLQVLPIAVLAFLAHLGRRRPAATFLAILWLALLLALLCFGLILIAAALAVTSPALGPAGVAVVAAAGLAGLILAAAVGLPAVRTALAGRLPLDPASPVHAIALSLLIGVTAVSFGQLAAMGGRPLLLLALRESPEMAEGVTPASLLYSLVWTIPAALIAAGYPVVRTLPEALERLGIVRPTARQTAGGLVAAVLLVGISLLLDGLIGIVWRATGWPVTDYTAFEELLRPILTPAGAVAVAVSAGIGEEIIFRGALQPRLGILLPNLAFTGLHAFQYGFDGLLVVFVIGIILGVVRERTNTTTAALVHGVYDFILVMASVLGFAS